MKSTITVTINGNKAKEPVNAPNGPTRLENVALLIDWDRWLLLIDFGLGTRP